MLEAIYGTISPMEDHIAKLKEYVVQQLNAGMSPEAITAQLQAVGWQSDMIQAAFVAVHGPQQATPVPPVPRVSPDQIYPSVAEHHQPITQPLLRSSANSVQASANPLKNLTQGARNVFGTNPLALIGALLLSIVVNAILIYFIVIRLLGDFFSVAFGVISTAQFLRDLIIIAAVFLVVNAFIQQVVARVVLTGSRRNKESFAITFGRASRRYPLALLTYASLVFIVAAYYFIITAVGRAAPIITVVLGIVGFLAVILFILRFIFIPFVLVDDVRPAGVMDTFRRSRNRWNKRSGPTFIYLLFCVVVYIIVAVVMHNVGHGGSPIFLAPSGFSLLASYVIQSSIDFLVTVLFLSGLCMIYVGADDPQLAAEQQPAHTSVK